MKMKIMVGECAIVNTKSVLHYNHGDISIGFYEDLAKETSISKSAKDITKGTKNREETIEVDVPFTVTAIAYTSFGAPICLFSSNSVDGPKVMHQLETLPKHEKIVKKKSVKLEEISQFESVKFLDTRKNKDRKLDEDGEDMEEEKPQIQEELAILNLRKKEQKSTEKYYTLSDERFYYVIFHVEFISPENFLKQRIKKTKGETTIIKSIPFSNRMTLSILDISQGEQNARELCRFNSIVNNKKNGIGRQIIGGVHFKPKVGWKFRSSNEFKPIPPRKLIIKLDSVEDISFLSDVYISLWFNDKKFKTKVSSIDSTQYSHPY